MYKVNTFPREQRKTNLNIWKAVINGRHSQKDPSDTAIRRVIVPFPTRLWNGLWEIVVGWKPILTPGLKLFLWLVFTIMLLLSRFSHVRLCATPWTAAHQAPLSTGFSRQEYWSGLPFPSPTMLSRLVIFFLPRSKHLLISWLQLPSAMILETKNIKVVTVSIVSPSICHEVMGLNAMILVFWILSFKPAFSLSSFTFFKRLFSSYSLSAMRVASTAYMRLLMFLPAILIPVCASSSLSFHMMYST